MEPERPIEKLLRAFARKRREDAGSPLELHPATRRMLQGEVARRHPKSAADRPSFAQMLASWWPRLAWAVPMLVVLGVAVWVLVPTQRKSGTAVELAKSVPVPAGQAADNLKQLGATVQTAQSPPALPPPTASMLASAGTDRRSAENKPADTGTGTLNLSVATPTESRTAKAGEPALVPGAPPQIATAESAARLDTITTGGVVTASFGLADAERSRLSINGAQTNFGAVSAAAAGGQLQTTNQSAPMTLASSDMPIPRGPGGGGFGGGGGGGGGGGRGGGGRGGRGGGRGMGGALGSGGGVAGAPQAMAPADTAPTPPAQFNAASSGAPSSISTQMIARSDLQPALPAEGAPRSSQQFNRSATGSQGSMGLAQQLNRAAAGTASGLPPASTTVAQPGLLGRYRNTANSAAPNQVLSTFRIEQSDSELRVIDSDGSTYTGTIERAAVPDTYRAPTDQKGAELLKSNGGIVARSMSATPASTAQSAQHFSFRVAGTNRTRNEPVVFTGDLVVLTNAAAATPQSGALGATLSPVQAKAPPLPFLQNSTVTGRAQVGTGREIEINAVPVAP